MMQDDPRFPQQSTGNPPPELEPLQTPGAQAGTHAGTRDVTSGDAQPPTDGTESPAQTAGTGEAVDADALAPGQDVPPEVEETAEGFSRAMSEMGNSFEQFVENPTFENALAIFGPMLLSLGQGIFALVVLVLIAMFVGKGAQRLTRRALDRVRLERTVVSFLSRIAKYAVWIVAIPIGFEIFGIKTTSIAAVIGAAGLAIGLALQGSLSNIAAGIMLLFLRPIKVGDIVELDGEFGTVEDVGIFYTQIHTFQKRLIYLPNSAVLSNKIENITDSPEYRADVPIGVAYGTDLRKAMDVLNRVAKEQGIDYKEKESDAMLTEFGDSSINFIVRVWTRSDEVFSTKSRIVLAIDEALKEANIEIPFPQRDLHVKEPITILTDENGKGRA